MLNLESTIRISSEHMRGKVKRKKLLFGLLILLLALVVVFIIWASTPARPTAAAISALQSNQDVTITIDSDRISFIPTSGQPATALIFYPGGRVDYRSYAGVLSQIAATGFEVYLVKMPLNLAVFGIDRAGEIIQTNGEIQNWVLAGHSLGGAMAAEFASTHLDEVSGLVLWAAYATEGSDLSQSKLSVLSISASNDGLATPDDLGGYRQFLPPTYSEVIIPGGNHAQFGDYGLQNGDGQATISASQQQAQIVGATTFFLEQFK